MKTRSLHLPAVIVFALCLPGGTCSSEDARVAPSVAPEEDAHRDQVASFWSSYREATRLRLAGDFAGAASEYETALGYRPDHEDALYYLGNVSMELGDWELAEKNWQELVRLNPRSLRGFGQLGNLYMCRPSIHLFDPARAELAFRQSVQLNPEETGALIRLGQAFLVAGRLDSAAAYLDAVIRTNPGSGQAGLLRSYIDWLRGGSESDPVSAGDAYQQILEPEGQVGEGDTRGGTGPMLARGAGCPLFEFETADPTADDPRAIEEDDARFRILSERLGAARSR